MPTILQSAGQACQTVDALKAGVVRALLELDDKIAALRRMVEMLRGSAQIVATPALPRLPQLGQLTLADYSQLRLACPQFLLPGLSPGDLNKIPGLKQLDALRSAVGNAYSSELNKLERSALGGIGQLEHQLGKAVSGALAKIGPVAGAIDCLCSVQNALTTDGAAERAKKTLAEITSSVKPTLLSGPLRQQISLYQDARTTLTRALDVRSSAARVIGRF